MRNQPDYEKIKREYKPNKIFSGTKGIFAVAIICFFGFWVVLFVGLSFSNPYRFSLPYNAIDFQKIAYIDNQFVMYGIDYNAKDRGLVIFNSIDGKQWDKSEIKITDDNQGDPISVAGTFNYFNGKCYLIGATVQPLVAPDCKHWQTQAVNSSESNNKYYLYQAHSSAIANNTLYVGGEKGVYKTTNGTTWTQEKLPYPEESNPHNFENHFYSMAVGNNKLITETNWWQNKQRRGLIYTKDLTTDKWSYEVYPVPVGNITRGKDRFVGMTESAALVLVDGDKNWKSHSMDGRSYAMTYGLNNQFICISRMQKSTNGEHWISYEPNDKRLEYTTSVACSNNECISISNAYQIVLTTDGKYFVFIDFDHKNPRPHWWRRFF